MSGTTRSSAELSPRHKRLLYQSWRRGTREMDLVLGRYADATITDWTDEETAQMEALLALPDPALWSWITGLEDVPPNHRSAALERIIAFHKAG